MTVTVTNISDGPFAPNGVTTAFPFTFKAVAGSDVSVIRLSSNGSETELSGYSVTVDPDGAGGTVTFSVPPVSGDPIYIISTPSFEQQTDFANQGAWAPASVNAVNDRAAARDLYLRDIANRGIIVPRGEDGFILPPALMRAGALLGFDGDGNPIPTLGAKGDPGGNVLSIGTFTTAHTLAMPAATSLVQVSGTSTPGDTGSGRQFVESTDVNTAFVAANPLTSFIDANGRGFREINPNTGAKVVPYVLVIAGQSNAQGAYAGGPNPASPMVKTWNGATGAWGGSDYTAAPWTLASPNGNLGKNNYALAAAHRIAEETRCPVYVIMDAAGGRPISDWVGAGTSSVRYAALKAKVEAALATPELSLSGVTLIDALIWAQGEEDCTTASFSSYYANLATLDAQLRAETWMGEFTPVLVPGMSWTHDRYEVAQAIQYFCAKAYNSTTGTASSWFYIPTRGMPTPDFTHFSGPALWEVGYNRIAPFLGADARMTTETMPTLFYGYGSGDFTPLDNIPGAIFRGVSLASWESRTDGPGTPDTFTGDGVTTAFTLNSRSGFNGGVTVNGMALVAGTDYTLPAAGANPYQIVFTTAPANGATIVVSYNTTINGPAAMGSLSWGYRCYADGNWSFAGGYKSVTTAGCNYTIAYGNNVFANDAADYSAGFGRDQTLQNTYTFAAGRGHNLLYSGQSAFGTFSVDSASTVVHRVGIGTSAGARKNGWELDSAGIGRGQGLGFLKGGAVTQATSKATGVTLNQMCGQITLNAASLAANSVVSFTFTNSNIAATDIIRVNSSGAATAGSYLVQAEALGAGTCVITVRNLTAGALAEALVLNFAIFKAVNS